MFSDEEYRGLTTAAGVVRRTDRGVLRVAGGDRAAWLQGLLTNDIEALGPGQTCYAAYLTPQGRMISDMRVVALADQMLLDVPASLSAALRDRMDGLIFAEDVQVADLTGAIALLEVHGPASTVRVGAARETGALSSASIVRDDTFGVPGWALFVPRESVSGVAAALIAAGAADVSLDTLDVLRIEAGVPRFLVDMTEETIPLEAGIEDRAISFTKGCYVGQEIIVRVTHRGGGRVARRLVGLLFGGADGASVGDRILAGERAIGQITSAAWSPALGRAIALGYVHRNFVQPGTEVQVGSGDDRSTATVSALPLVAR